jgi:cell division septum initiation protein DivIVA
MNIGSTSGSSSSIATAGVQQSSEQVKQAAQQVVESTTSRATQGTIDATDALLKLKEGEQGVKLNAKVLDAADKQLGSLLDIEA